MITLRIRTFAELKQYMGDIYEIKIPDYTTGRDVKDKLKDFHPEIMDLIDDCRFIANDTYLPDQEYITQEEIFLMPPTSGM